VTPASLVSCTDQSYLYMAESERNIVIRFTPWEVWDSKSQLIWPVDAPNISGLSVNAENHILVTAAGYKIQEYTGDGYLLREIRTDVQMPQHAIHLADNVYLVSSRGDPHGVSLVRNDGETVVSFMESDGATKMGEARGLAVFADKKRFLVSDQDTNKVVMVNEGLSKGRDLDFELEGAMSSPSWLVLDEIRDLLYIGERDGGRIIIVGGLKGFMDDTEN